MSQIELFLSTGHPLQNVRLQYDPEVKRIFLNVRFFAARAVQCFLILLPANSPGLSGHLPLPGYLAMAGLPQNTTFPQESLYF